IGKNEVENKLLSVRQYGSEDTTEYTKAKFLKELATLKKSLK
ncbi:hypothetical protein CP01DC11_1323, partial [Chlamydia psittaci 01DC11]